MIRVFFITFIFLSCSPITNSFGYSFNSKGDIIKENISPGIIDVLIFKVYENDIKIELRCEDSHLINLTVVHDKKLFCNIKVALIKHEGKVRIAELPIGNYKLVASDLLAKSDTVIIEFTIE